MSICSVVTVIQIALKILDSGTICGTIDDVELVVYRHYIHDNSYDSSRL